MGGRQTADEAYAHLVGHVASLTRTVGSDDTAIALGSGDVPVLATPRLLAWLEAATVAAIPDLPAGRTSVGTRIELEHLGASAIGAVVTSTARVVAVAGRTVTFDVEAGDPSTAGPVVVARGRVVRTVLDRERFLSRLRGAVRPD